MLTWATWLTRSFVVAWFVGRNKGLFKFLFCLKINFCKETESSRLKFTKRYFNWKAEEVTNGLGIVQGIDQSIKLEFNIRATKIVPTGIQY